jgi:DNA-binding YbaB/EbfC family protein
MAGGQPNLQALLKQAQQMQQDLAAAQQQLAEATVEGSGGGLVRATVRGTGELVDLKIDPSAVDPADVETLQDLVVAAVRDAGRAAQQVAAERLGPLSEGLSGLGLPGM